MALGPTAVQFGTFSVGDLNVTNNTPIIQFNLEDVGEYTKELLVAYNALLNEEVDFFVESTTERVLPADGAGTLLPTENDEWGVVDNQKLTGVQFMGLPLTRLDVGTQWTRDYFENATVSEFVRQVDAILNGDSLRYARDIRKALFTPTNNNSYVDRFVDMMNLPVKALANADGFPIPPSPTGKTFDPTTHTHYMGTAGATLAASDVDALVANVIEHFNGGNLVLFVPSDVEASMSGNPANFPLYIRDTYFGNLPSENSIRTDLQLAQSRPNNRRTGTYRDATVWVKPWMPAGSLACLMVDTVKPIARRLRVSPARAANPYTGGGDLRLLYEASDLPLHCKYMRREHGFGIRNRVAAAVMSVGGSVYAQPAQL